MRPWRLSRCPVPKGRGGRACQIRTTVSRSRQVRADRRSDAASLVPTRQRNVLTGCSTRSFDPSATGAGIRRRSSADRHGNRRGAPSPNSGQRRPGLSETEFQQRKDAWVFDCRADLDRFGAGQPSRRSTRDHCSSPRSSGSSPRRRRFRPVERSHVRPLSPEVSGSPQRGQWCSSLSGPRDSHHRGPSWMTP